MPPKQARLSESTLADLKKWIESGAVDPREGEMVSRDKSVDWETAYNNG